MQRYETFENKLHDKGDFADTAKIETKISKLEEKFSKWDHEVEARIQSLEQKATVNCTTEMMKGPSDEELIEMMVQEEMSKKKEEDRDTESRKRNIVIYRVPEKTTQNVSERKANGESYVRVLLDAVFNIKLEEGDVEKLYRLGQ